MKNKSLLCIATLGCILTASLCADKIIQNFESYESSAALKKSIHHVMPSASVELEFDTGLKGSNSMNLSLNTSKDPWYSQVELNVAPVSLTGVKSVIVYLKRLPKSSNELIDIELKDSDGQTIKMGGKLRSLDISESEYQGYLIDVSDVQGKFVSRVSINAGATDGGTVNLAIDDITLVANK